MSPFYRKERETGNWEKLTTPVDIHLGSHVGDFVTIFPGRDLRDPEQVRICVFGDVIVRDEDGTVYYPSQDNPDGILINRRDIFIESTMSGARKAIIHSEEPIGKK